MNSRIAVMRWKRAGFLNWSLIDTAHGSLRHQSRHLEVYPVHVVVHACRRVVAFKLILA